ncbi:hypothetical protein [Rhizobium sp. CNPSo 4039]|uniref:tetratricopeptide repeat protein n=1 Tax=Rhizobium sp. CNPSo 4039 TaxID=3021409 RepID=UPI002551A729|nr:hypothetical protein [Rhizobium sp. CNPSo 4039]MDK4717271.1 hypothetical protein [Rhizobium sp. CNPSo 4039]
MGSKSHEIGEREASLDSARLELERLLGDDRFRVSDRQRDILRYLAERRLAGCEEGVKAYSIALDVLGRPSGFDAANDPIVRIEISRLRTSLESYYSVFGAELGVSIHIPKGSYLTLFLKTPLVREYRTLAITNELVRPTKASGLEFAITPVKRRRYWIAVAGAALAILGLLAAAGLLRLSPAITTKPTLTVTMLAASPDMVGEAGLARDMLLAALTQFQTVVVAKPTFAAVRKGGTERSYDVEIKYYGDSDDRSVWWQIVDRSSGDLLKSGVERVEANGRSVAAVQEDMAGILARRIAATRGIVNTIEMQHSPKGALGNACVLRAEFALDEGGSLDAAAAADCLERTLVRVPDDPDANALLARVLLSPRGHPIDAATRARALALAKRATSLAPLSDRAQTALMTVHFLDGRADAAIEAGNRAISLNPHSPEVAASMGLVLFSSGYWKAGVDLARTASNESDAPPRDATLVLALDAYRNGNWSEASLLAEQVNCTDFMVRAVRAAALGQLGAPDASARLDDAEGRDRDFERLFHQRMAAARMQPQIVADLENGLSKAGANFAAVAGNSRP